MALSSRASVGSTSRSKRSSEVRLRGTVRSTRTRATSCSGGGRASPTSATSELCRASRRQRCCAAASPARTSAAPENGRDSGARTAGCGPSWREPFAQFDPPSSSWRTSDSSATGASMKSSPTWPRQGSMRSGRACRQPTSAPPIDARGCSYWPTPTAASYGSSQNGCNSTRPSAGTPGLERLGSWWPTPCASDARDSARHTVRADAASHSGTSLTDKIRQWCSRHSQTMGRHGRVGQGKAFLNPEFVETLMGLPPGYTLVDDADAYDALVAELCPNRQLRLF